ncbi:MAG: histidine phosphatase family protein [Candidatus Dormiibacterota bacterium]
MIDPAPSERVIWLVRHGESTWNARGLVQGQTQVPVLTRRGVAQAQEVARQLADEPVGVVWSSDLQRALQTADPIAAALGLPVGSDRRLRERSYGRAEGTGTRTLSPRFSGIRYGRVTDADAAPPNGESIRELYARAADIVEAIQQLPEPGDLVLVTHGGMVRVLLALLVGTGPDEMAWLAIENGLVVRRVVPSEASNQTPSSSRRVADGALR